MLHQTRSRISGVYFLFIEFHPCLKNGTKVRPIHSAALAASLHVMVCMVVAPFWSPPRRHVHARAANARRLDPRQPDLASLRRLVNAYKMKSVPRADAPDACASPPSYPVVEKRR